MTRFLLGVMIRVHAAVEQVLHVKTAKIVPRHFAGIKTGPAELANRDHRVGCRTARTALVWARDQVFHHL